LSGGRTRTLLIVDDEERILSSLRRALRAEDFAVVTADNAAAGLQILASQRVDCVVSDHKMPGLSGLEFLERVAALHPGCARILITGWTEAVPREELERIGVRALIPKPWVPEELRRVLRQAMGLA
jgi:DNA-binding NtrC family response regulator